MKRPLPAAWREARLGFLVETQVPQRDKPDPLTGSIPWVRIEDFNGQEIRASKSGQGVTPEQVRAMNLRVFEPGTVMCSCSCSMGTTAIVREPLVSNQTFIGLKPGTELESRFLFYLMGAKREELQANATGAIQQYLSRDDFRSLRIPLPPPDEQRRIADFLDAETARIDNLIDKRRRMRDLLALKRERVIASVLGLERGNGFHALVPLKYMVEGVSVGIVITPAKWYVDSGGTPALRSLNVRPGSINSDDLVHISAEGHAEHVKSRLQAGDVVVVRTGQAGAAAVVPPEFDGANCIDLIIIRPGHKVAPKYLEYVLNSEHARAQISEHAVGSIQAHFNVGAMKQIPIPALPRDTQEDTVAQLDQIVDKLDRLQGRLAKQERLLAEHRQALITAAVTGQFDVTTASGRKVTEGVTV